METPEGDQGRYDITRTHTQHEILFKQAGLTVLRMEEGVETHTFALKLSGSD